MKVDIVEVISPKLTKAFIDFPHDLYRSDPLYVPELYLAQSEIHNRKKNPFFEHSEVKSYLAYADGNIVGRISAILNNPYNSYHNCNVGFFGFFDSIDSKDVAHSLFSKAKEWLISKNVEAILGPTNFSITTDTGGLLVDGFDKSPIVMMTYNAAYYIDLVESFGFVKDMDLYAYMIYAEKVDDRSVRLAKALEERLKRSEIVIRNINLKNFKYEVNQLKEVYDQAWEKNWGFNPATAKEFKHLADGLKLLVDPAFCYIAEHDGKPIGFSISLPDINEIVKEMPRGRLFPFGIFKLLMRKKKTKYVRIATLGVIESYRKKGIEAIFFAKTIETARKNGVQGGEASWILENNEMMVQGAEKLNGERYKTYRMYRLDL